MDNQIKPFVVEFMGIPSENKSLIIESLRDMFRENGLYVCMIDNIMMSSYYKEVLDPKLKNLPISTKYQIINEEVRKELQTKTLENKGIILIDGSLNERQLWNYYQYDLGNICDPHYFSMRDIYSNFSRKLIDLLVIFCNRNDSTLENGLEIDNRLYNQYLFKLRPLYESSVNKYLMMDINSMSKEEISYYIFNEIINKLDDKSVLKLRRSYGLK